MKYIEEKKSCEFIVDSANHLSCKNGYSGFNICGRCQSCLLSSKLSNSTEWLLRSGDLSKRRFFTGIFVRCQNLNILETIQDVLKVTLGKDFTYARSRQKQSLPEDMRTWSSDRALDPQLVGKEIVETWDWFSRSKCWTKANYILGLLSLCDTELLHALENLTRVLIVREKRSFLHQDVVLDNLEDDIPSIPESYYSFHSDDHLELDLLICSSSSYERLKDVWAVDTADTLDVPNLEPRNFQKDQVAVSGPKKASWAGLEDLVSPRMALEDVSEGSYTGSLCSEDPALMVNPRSSNSLSGVNRFKDFIRLLPVHLAKRILGHLDKATLISCISVSQHWRYLTEETLKDIVTKRMVENQAMLMQGSSLSGVSSFYAKIREILVPIGEDEKQCGDVICKSRRDRGFEAAYVGIKTKAVQMDERNVYCGVYNILVVSDRKDMARVVHYSGGQLIAVGSKDRLVHLLDMVTTKEVLPVFKGHVGSVRAVLLCEDRGLLITGSYDLSIRCWNLKTGVCVMLFRGHQGTINCLDLHGNKLVSGAKDFKVKGKCYKKLKFKHPSPVQCVKINISCKTVLSSCEKGQVKMWDMEAAALIKLIDAHQGPVNCLFFDQWHILSGGADGYVMAWSTNCDFRKCLMAYQHPREVLALAFLFLRVITGCMDGKIRIFNFLTGDCLRAIMSNSQHSPVNSLYTHKNNIVINTSSGVLLFQFTKVHWDYSLPSEREVVDVVDWDSPVVSSVRKYPYWYIRAVRSVLVGSSNQKVYHRAPKPGEKPALSHHARSLSTSSMQQAKKAQQESLRPATWCELRSYRRSKAYINLQPEFIAKPPSALSPGKPVKGHTAELISRTSSARESFLMTKWVPSCSERAVQNRIRRRGPHCLATTEKILLTVNAAQQICHSDQSSINMEANASVRDDCGSPPPLARKDPGAKAYSSQQRQSQPPVPSPVSPAESFQGMGRTFTPLLTQPVVLRHSLRSRSVHSTLQVPGVSYPPTAHDLRVKPPTRSDLEQGRPQTSGGTGKVVRKVGAFTTTDQQDVCAPRRVFLRIPSKHPERRVEFEMTGGPGPTSRNSPLDPFRERCPFRLRTSTQQGEYELEQVLQQRQSLPRDHHEQQC